MTLPILQPTASVIDQRVASVLSVQFNLSYGTAEPADWKTLFGLEDFTISGNPNRVETSNYNSRSATGIAYTSYKEVNRDLQVTGVVSDELHDGAVEEVHAYLKERADTAQKVQWRAFDQDGVGGTSSAISAVGWDRQQGAWNALRKWNLTLAGGTLEESATNPMAVPPTLTTVLPAGESVGDTVTLTGTGFDLSHAPVTAVKFGATDAPGFTVVSATSITVAIPVGATGAVDVTVVNKFGTSNAVSYTVV